MDTVLYVNAIATPLAGESFEKKILLLTKKIIKVKGVKRGVKEVGKSIRKGLTGIVIFAADVSPIDVISHLPIQCEEKGIPYIFVRSRLELGKASDTKRPTSVVLLVEPDVKEHKALHGKFMKFKKVIKSYN